MKVKVKDKYKDPENIKILAEASKAIREFRKEAGDRNSFRVGVYAGMNIALRQLGREPL